MSDTEFKGDNPGAVKYGNFINYYKFHPAENRIKLFPRDIWKIEKDTCLCLDIGCNTGDLTISLLEFLKSVLPNKMPCYFLGIDVDPTLIIRAKENVKYSDVIDFQCVDFMNMDHLPAVKRYLDKFQRNRFNVSFCLSITMWIHLNHGDEGLRIFLRRVCEMSDIVVVEPQPWKCYKTALKRLRQASSDFPLFKTLKHRQDVEKYIEKVLEECSFLKLAETEHTSWGRKILFYGKQT